MSPQHSSPAPATSRCRDALQVKGCTEYKLMHAQAYLKIRLVRHIVSGRKLPSYFVSLCDIDAWTKNTPLIFRAPNEPRHCVIARPLAGCSSDSQRRFSPIGKHIKFNRMKGSPGDPPANLMHISKRKRITPVNHRLVSDPIGKEADWETST
jgi:hypothetical protein